MKMKISIEYLRRITKLMKSKSNSGNLVKSINTWAVSLLRSSAAFGYWKRSGLQEIDGKTNAPR